MPELENQNSAAAIDTASPSAQAPTPEPEKPLSPLLEAIKRPIPGNNPCGVDVSYDDDFQKIKAEFDRVISTQIDQSKAVDDAKKLLELTAEKRRELEKKKQTIESKSLTSGPSGKDYPMIVGLATKILSEKSKDLRAAAYLCVALTYAERFAGLAEGLAAINILAQTFWEGLYPAKHRVPARQSIFTEFLKPRLSDAIAPEDANGVKRIQVNADDREPLEQALKTLGELQKLAAAHLPQESQSALAALTNVVKECFDKAPKPAPPVSATPSTVSSSTAPPSAAPTSTAPTASMTVVTSADGKGTEIKSEQDAFDSIRRAVIYWRNLDRTSPRPYRLVRSARWEALANEPANQKIPPPRVERRNYFNTLLQKAEWNKLLDEGEATFTEAPFHLWLDLQRLLVAAMDALGAPFQQGRLAILQELAILLQRLPKLPHLVFNDGTRFADAATQDWIEETVMPVLGGGEASNAGASLAANDNELTGQFEAAKKIFSQGDLAGAMAYLQEGAAADASRKVRFRRRLYMASLCLRGNQPKLARPLLEELQTEVEKFSIDAWEPPLALEMWKNLHQCYEALAATAPAAGKPALQESAERIFEKICRLDMGYALATTGAKPKIKRPAPPNGAEKTPVPAAEKAEAQPAEVNPEVQVAAAENV